jgi:large subunit ribosomal protein L28
METGRPAHGPPRGLVNKMVGVGLPPWAAWCARLNKHSMYRMSGVSTRSFLPKQPQQVDGIWLNESVRMRVRASSNVQHVFKQLKYPWMKTGIWYSEALDHWVQVPQVQAAQYAIEQDGGFDNFIMKRSGAELKSQYGERMRRHILVRRKETEKNFVLKTHARSLADVMAAELDAATNAEELQAVIDKYGLSTNFLRKIVRAQLKRVPAPRPSERRDTH